MKAITKEESGKLIAHWRLAPTTEDLNNIRNIVADAVAGCGLDAKIEIVSRPLYCDVLGHGRVTAKITIRNAADAVRQADGTLVVGMDTITIDFDKCAGLFSLDAHFKRHKEEDELLSSLPETEAMEAIDNLPWDAVAVSFSGRTNGKARDYRRRHFYPYEGSGHYDYGAVWGDLADAVSAYVGGIARSLGYEGKAKRKMAA